MLRIASLLTAAALAGVMIGALTREDPGYTASARALTEPPAPTSSSQPPSETQAQTPVQTPKAEPGKCPIDANYADKDPNDLQPAAGQAWRTVKQAALAEGVTLCMNGGKRTVAQQLAEFQDAVKRYGNEELARQYVLPPEKSMHVKGLAVDVGPTPSAAWLERTKGEYGWCRRYDNEPWHFEYDAKYAERGCPARKPHA